jgi:hypothetical protein
VPFEVRLDEDIEVRPPRHDRTGVGLNGRRAAAEQQQ